MAICDVYHYDSSLLKLVQDLKKLNKLPLINLTNPARGEDLVNLLSFGLNRLPTYLQSRCDQEDNRYFQQKGSKRRSLAESDDKYLIEFIDKDFGKVTNLELKSLMALNLQSQFSKCFTMKLLMN